MCLHSVENYRCFFSFFFFSEGLGGVFPGRGWLFAPGREAGAGQRIFLPEHSARSTPSDRPALPLTPSRGRLGEDGQFPAPARREENPFQERRRNARLLATPQGCRLCPAAARPRPGGDGFQQQGWAPRPVRSPAAPLQQLSQQTARGPPCAGWMRSPAAGLPRRRTGQLVPPAFCFQCSPAAAVPQFPLSLAQRAGAELCKGPCTRCCSWTRHLRDLVLSPGTLHTCASACRLTHSSTRAPHKLCTSSAPQAHGEVLESLRMNSSPGSAPHPSCPRAAGWCWWYLGLGAAARDPESWDCLFPSGGGNPKSHGGWALRAVSPGLCLSARLIAKAVLPHKRSSCLSWVRLALAMS